MRFDVYTLHTLPNHSLEPKMSRNKASHKDEKSFLSEEAKAICAADKALIEAESSRNLDLAMDYLAPGVILQPPDQPAIVGRESVREFYANWFAIPYTAIHVRAQKVSVASSKDIAYLIGESSLVLSGPHGERQLPGKYLGVWRKVDNKWLLAAISWNANVISDEG
jgi:ketosteroid isomerase-like protein